MGSAYVLERVTFVTRDDSAPAVRFENQPVLSSQLSGERSFCPEVYPGAYALSIDTQLPASGCSDFSGLYGAG